MAPSKTLLRLWGLSKKEALDVDGVVIIVSQNPHITSYIWFFVLPTFADPD
jgi:hypothetical protein